MTKRVEHVVPMIGDVHDTLDPGVFFCQIKYLRNYVVIVVNRIVVAIEILVFASGIDFKTYRVSFAIISVIADKMDEYKRVTGAIFRQLCFDVRD